MQTLPDIISQSLLLDKTAVCDDLSMREEPNWDSLSHMQLIQNIEKNFDLTLSLDEIVVMTSMPNICAVLQSHGVPGV